MAWEPTLQSSPLPIEVGGTNSQTVISAPTASSWSGWDANSNMSAKNFLSGLSIIPTSSGTTTLTVSSNETQVFTGTLTQICVMPAVSTLVLGQSYRLINKSSGVVTVNSSGGDLIQTMESNTTVLITCTSLTGTDASSWTWVYNPAAPFDFPLSVSLGGTGYSSVNSSPSPSSWAGWDANSNLSANNTINGSATTVTSGGTTTLTVASAQNQYFTGTMTQTMVMPVTSTLQPSMYWSGINQSTGIITVNSSGGNLIATILPGESATIVCQLVTGTTAASWFIQNIPGTSNISFTSASNLDVPVIVLSYSSAYILGVFYPNLLQMAHSQSFSTGYTTINYGNVQLLTSSLFTTGSSATTSIVGDNILAILYVITLNANALTTFSMNSLLFLNQVASFTLNSLVTFNFPSLQVANGFTINSTSLTTLSMPSLINFNGTTGFTGTCNALTTVVLTSLVNLNGTWGITSNALTSLSLPALTIIGVNFAPVATSLQTVSMPLLTTVGGTFSPTLAALTTLTLTNLTTITGAFALVAASLTTLALPALTTLGTGFSVNCAAATTVTLTSLSTITGAVAASFASLTTLSLPALTSVSTTFTLTAANLVTFSMNSGLLNIGGNFTMTGMKLDQTSVDGILVSLAALDGTGGTTSYNNRVVNLSGGTSSAPSATGLTAKATLQARGCTVTTN